MTTDPEARLTLMITDALARRRAMLDSLSNSLHHIGDNGAPAFTVDLMRKDLRLAGDERSPGRLGAVTEAAFDAAPALGHGDDIAVVADELRRPAR